MTAILPAAQAAVDAVVSASDFQFLSGLIEVCIALNFGFAISPVFRNPHRASHQRKYNALENSLRLSCEDVKDAKDVSSQVDGVRLDRLKKKKNEADLKGEKIESKCASLAYFVGAISTLLLAFVASVPMLEFWWKALDGKHNYIYGGTWVFALLSLVSLAASYAWIAFHWSGVDKQFDEFNQEYEAIKAGIKSEK